jgi:hypothetical protein
MIGDNMYEKYQKYGFVKTDNKQIINQVKKLLKTHPDEIVFTDRLWEIRRMLGGFVLVMYNKKEKYIIEL